MRKQLEICTKCSKCDAPMIVLEPEPAICSKCQQKCKDMIDSNPTWYGKMYNDKMVTAVCVDCWNQGERF
jgi:hypothetical protein